MLDHLLFTEDDARQRRQAMQAAAAHAALLRVVSTTEKQPMRSPWHWARSILRRHGRPMPQPASQA